MRAAYLRMRMRMCGVRISKRSRRPKVGCTVRLFNPKSLEGRIVNLGEAHVLDR